MRTVNKLLSLALKHLSFRTQRCIPALQNILTTNHEKLSVCDDHKCLIPLFVCDTVQNKEIYHCPALFLLKHAASATFVIDIQTLDIYILNQA